MRKLALTIFAFLLIPAWAFAGYPEKVEKGIIDRAMAGQMMIFAGDYDSAIKHFAKLEKDFPDHPIGYFGQMAAYEMQMVEKGNFYLAEEFEAVTKKGRRAIIKTLNRRPSDFDLLVCGSLNGLEGFYYARRRQWWAAYTGGVRSRQTFKRIKKRNPKFYDADFGLGMYIYWRSVYANELKVIPFFPDKRQEGIEILERVVEDGHFAKDLAKVNLGLIWLEEKQFAKAHAIFKEYLDRFPKNILLHMFDARTLIAGKRYDEAVDVLRSLQKIDPSQVKSHYFIGMARVLQRNPKYFEEAEKELMIYDGIAPKGEWKAATNYWLGRLEEMRGNKAKAVKYYEIALEENPNIKRLKLRIRALGSGL